MDQNRLASGHPAQGCTSLGLLCGRDSSWTCLCDHSVLPGTQSPHRVMLTGDRE